MQTSDRMPSRLHHTAYVSKDLEATRHFYEDLLGMPLVAAWSESDELFGKVRTYCHAFFGMADGGALAFFQFANPEDQEEFGPEMPKSPFHHVAVKTSSQVQEQAEKRLRDAGYKEPDIFILEHGYCRSLYVEDPNGMLVEFCVDHQDAESIAAERQADAHDVLKRWLAGDHRSNNTYR